MSWQLASFAILGLGLAAGFTWYERSRPDAKTVALVGTLAALACLGRVAFAAVPNVKPTTDIVLIAGYALGGAPGYVVGAVAGLTSNFFFGQGPWTPWQMAGWGLTGIVGAALAQAVGFARGRTGRAPAGSGRVGRRQLASVCFAVGFAFTALQDAGDWVTYSDHSLGQLGVYVGQGLGYDLIHAVGCVAFALAFGPAMIRALQRFQRRLSIDWVAAGGSVLPAVLVASVAAGAVAVAGASRARAATPSGAVHYLVSSQNRDGGFGNAPGEASNSMVSGWAIMALVAVGHPAAALSTGAGAASAAQYLSRSAGTDLGDPGSIERTVLAAVAAGLNPAALGGHDLTAALAHAFNRDGSVAGQTNLTAFGVLAERAAGLPLSASTVPWLLRQQDRDGGFNFATRADVSDVDDTGAVLEALAAAARPGGLSRPRTPGGTLVSDIPERAVIARALGFLRTQQNRDGGFPSQPGGPSNSQSTAFAVQGLIAAGISPGSVRRSGGRTPIQYLDALTAPSGAVAYARGSEQTPVWVTAEALLALAGRPLPIVAPPRTPATPGHRSQSTRTSSTPSRTSGHTSGSQRASARGRSPRGHRTHRLRGAHGQAPGAAAVSAALGWIGTAEGVALGLTGR